MKEILIENEIMFDETIKDGIEALLLEEVPGVIGVELVQEGF